MAETTVTISGRDFGLSKEAVEQAVKATLPDPVQTHYVVIGGTRYPPKQVVALVTGLDKADFNTHHARAILGRLGFSVGRLQPAHKNLPAGHFGDDEAEALRPFMGKWVAQKGVQVMVAADSPEAVLAWLATHKQQPDAMFRVPTSEAEPAGPGPY